MYVTVTIENPHTHAYDETTHKCECGAEQHTFKYSGAYSQHTITCTCGYEKTEACTYSADCATKCTVCNKQTRTMPESAHNVTSYSHQSALTTHAGYCHNCKETVIAKCTYDFACSEACRLCGGKNQGAAAHTEGFVTNFDGTHSAGCTVCKKVLSEEKTACASASGNCVCDTCGGYTFAGKGTESDPYIAMTYNELNKLLDIGGNTTIYIKLGADISEWDSLYSYTPSVLDLDGHKLDISPLRCYRKMEIKNGEIDAIIYVNNNVLIENVCCKEYITVDGDYTLTLKDCDLQYYLRTYNGGKIIASNVTINYYDGIYENNGGSLELDGVVYTESIDEPHYPFEHTDANGDDVCDKCYDLLSTPAKASDISLTLGGDIGVNFYWILSRDVLNDLEAYFLVKLPNGNTNKILVSEAPYDTPNNPIPGVNYKKITGLVAAKEMAEDVVIELYSGGKCIASAHSSVRDYAKRVFDFAKNGSEMVDDKLVTMMKAMLNYGAASQTLFGHNTDDLANSILAEADKVVADIDTSALTPTTMDGSVTGFTPQNFSCILEATTTIRHYFTLTLAEGEKFTDYSFHIDGIWVEPTLTEDGTMYYVDITGISATDMDRIYTFKVTKYNSEGNETINIMASVHSYMLSATKYSTDKTLIATINAMYAYGTAAETYFAQ